MLQTKQGVVVYQRTYGASDETKLDISDLQKFSEAVLAAATLHDSPDDAKKMPADNNTVIVIHNTNENDIQSVDLLPEFDIDAVSCPRCRYKITLAKKLLASIPVVGKKDIRGVCDLCALSRIPCHVCQNVIKQFVTIGIKDERLEDYKKKRIMSYITNVKRLLQSDVTVGQKRMVRSFSECNITKIIERKHKRDQHLRRPKSGPELDFAVQHSSDEFEEVLDMSKKKKVIIQDESISEVPKADISTAEMYLKKNLDELVSVKPALKTVAPQKEVQRTDRVDIKITPYRSGDVVKATNSDTVLGIGTTGLLRRAHSDDSLITSFTGITKEILGKNFKYFFPRIIKKDENILKTSAELIQDTKTRLQSNFQDEIEKQDAIKLEEEQIKMIKLQENKMAKEELRRKIELAKRQEIIPPDDNISYEIDKRTGFLVEKKKGKALKKAGIEKKKKTVTGKQRKELDKTMQKIIENGKHKLDVKLITGKQKLIKKEKRESDGKAVALKRKLIKKEPEEKERKQKNKTKEKQETKLMKKEPEEKERKQKVRTKEKQETDDMHTSSRKLTKKEKETPIKRKHLSKETLWAQSIPKGFTNTRDLVSKDKKQTTTEPVKKETATRVKITAETVDKKVGSDVISDIPDETEIPTKDGLSGDGDRQTDKIKKLKGVTENKAIVPHKHGFHEDKVEKKHQLTKEHVKVLNKVLTKQEKLAVKEAKLKSQQKSRDAKIKKRADKALQPLEDDNYEEIVHKKMAREPDKKNIQSEKETKDATKLEVGMDKIKILPSGDNLLVKLISMKHSADSKETKNIKPIAALPIPIRRRVMHTQTTEIEPEDQSEAATDEIIKGSFVGELVLGNEITNIKNVPPEPEPKSQPVLFQSVFDEIGSLKGEVTIIETPSATASPGTGGVFKYALSDRRFIDNGWTLLPEEKITRKMNIYRMRPTQPEFDWFERNKDKRLLYDSGEKLAEIDHSGRGRWYYKNGRIALDYYDTAEANAQQRFVLYSSGEVDDRGRSLPVTILGMFDYIGNGIVFDHYGKIRLKYNQSEGVLLDRGIGPVSHWKWHSLNDPPVLQQVMIDTQMNFKDPDILALSNPDQDLPRQDDQDMLAIEFENFIKSKNVKPNQKFEPHQIRLKALKINDHLSLRILDQKTIYLLFRDGSTKLKLNLGMELDHNDIVDTSSCELGQVTLSMENLPAVTESLENMQKSLAKANGIHRLRRARELWKRPPPPGSSADKLTAAASRPLKSPLQTASLTSPPSKCRLIGGNNLYYNTRLI